MPAPSDGSSHRSSTLAGRVLRVGTLELRARHAFGVLLMLLAGAFALRAMGRVWWCREGDLAVWSWNIWTPHNSQHVVDPYTATHVLHGIALYGLLWLLLRKVLSAADRGLVAVALEVGWEILENTNAVIEHYRETTISLNYYGDSVINSIGDTLAFAGGYVLAASIPVWASVLGFVVTDALLLAWIHDSLLLNVLMLVHPIDAIKNWQMGATTAGQRGSGVSRVLAAAFWTPVTQPLYSVPESRSPSRRTSGRSARVSLARSVPVTARPRRLPRPGGLAGIPTAGARDRTRPSELHRHQPR